jgi:hypothetical protein
MKKVEAASGRSPIFLAVRVAPDLSPARGVELPGISMDSMH